MASITRCGWREFLPNRGPLCFELGSHSQVAESQLLGDLQAKVQEIGFYYGEQTSPNLKLMGIYLYISG